MNLIFGVLGLIGGILCAIGDMLFDLKGSGSKKLGKYKMIESNWEAMPVWRFRASVLLAAIGVPLYALGFVSLARQMSNETFAVAFWIVTLIGSLGGFFIHAMCCVFPVIYKTMKQHTSFDVIEETQNAAFDTIKIPFIVYFTCLVIISSIMIAFAIIFGYLQLSPLFIILTPLVLMIIGVSLRTLKKEWFNDLPGIIMPSIGLAMIGLMAAIHSIG